MEFICHKSILSIIVIFSFFSNTSFLNWQNPKVTRGKHIMAGEIPNEGFSMFECLKCDSIKTKPIAASTDEILAVYGSVLAFRSAFPNTLFIM